MRQSLCGDEYIFWRGPTRASFWTHCLFLGYIARQSFVSKLDFCIHSVFRWNGSLQIQKIYNLCGSYLLLKYNTNWFFYSKPCLTENSTVHCILKCRILKLQFDLTLHQSKQNNDCKMMFRQNVKLQCIIYVYVGIRHFCCWLCAYTYTVRQKNVQY